MSNYNHSMTFFSKKITYFILLNLFFAASCTLNAVSDWTVLVYVQGNNNLHNFALKNFSDMATVGSNQHLTTLVQWYQPNHQGIWRYKVEKGKMVLDECTHVETDGNSSKDLVNSMQWATSKFPAKKYSLILWDHGIGIIDPVWGKQSPWTSSAARDALGIHSDAVNSNPRIQIEGLTSNANMLLAQNLESSVTTTMHRGILFNEHSKTYMDNQSLSRALHEIKTVVLKNKKIDLLGMDACLMAMVEIGYLARNYAHYLVASQEVELAHGWNYLPLMQALAEKPLTAVQAAQCIVSSYQTYYKDKIQFYTQSAINLGGMNTVKDSIDLVISSFKKCQQKNKELLNSFAKIARRSCLQFSASSYVDLHTYYAELEKQLESPAAYGLHGINDLKTALSLGMKLIEQTVISNTAGKNLARAKGLSIYFPQGKIDASYPRTEFARSSLWQNFIQDLYGE